MLLFFVPKHKQIACRELPQAFSGILKTEPHLLIMADGNTNGTKGVLCMRKIPTLFERTFEDHRVTGITPKVYPGMEWVMRGEGEATVKIDGACCAIFGGKLFARYDAKIGKGGKQKAVPENAIPCQDEPDPVTGHFPCWIPAEDGNPGQKWLLAAFRNAPEYGLVLYRPDGTLIDHTYEAIGPHFQGNPYHLDRDVLVPHGLWKIKELNTGKPRAFEEIKDWLSSHDEEGIVFWKDGEPRCKIKRTDFGLPWKSVRVTPNMAALRTVDSGIRQCIEERAVTPTCRLCGFSGLWTSCRNGVCLRPGISDSPDSPVVALDMPTDCQYFVRRKGSYGEN